MPDVSVTPVSSRREQRAFVDLPWKLYRGDPYWVPPLVDNQRQLLGYKHHPFHDNAEVQTFLVRRGGEVVGRVAAIHNHAHNRHYQENRGFFGFFESIDDTAVSRALFDAVRDWLGQRGARDIRGPTNPSMNHECGLLIEGFDDPPCFMMTYNPPFYARLVEDYGFRKAHDLLAFFGKPDQLLAVSAKLSPLVDNILKRTGAKIRTIDTSRFMEDVETFLDMYNKSLLRMWGFVPFPKAEIRHMARELHWVVIPEWGVAAEVDGEVVGVVLGLPDYNPVIKAIDGRLFPFGWWKLLRSKQRLTRARLISINVVPEYQTWGLGIVLMTELGSRSLQKYTSYTESEFSWVAESNHLAIKGLRKVNARHYKTYRMYDCKEARGAEA